MEATLPPRGLIADLVTPLTDDGSLDVKGLERLIERVVPHVHGVLAAGPAAGEGFAFDCDTRAEIIDRVLAAVGGRVPVLAWITAESPEETLSCLEILDRTSAGTPAGLLYWTDTPLYYHSNRGLPVHYREMADRLRRPLVLHNDPDFISRLKNPLKRSNIRTAVLKELVIIDSIAGLVFSGSMDRARNYQKAGRGRPGFRIYDHNEGNFLDFPSMSGVVSIGAVLAPRQWHAITETSLQRAGSETHYPDFLHQIWEMGRHVRALREAYRDAPVPVVKAALHRMGVISSARTAVPFGSDVSGAVERLLRETQGAVK